MVMYRRNLLAGGTYFFTVNLRDRHSALLLTHAHAFREIIREVKTKLPFSLDAMVIMPNHWHAVWTLPDGDTTYTRRIRLVKARFTAHLVKQGVPLNRNKRSEYDLWQPRFWEHTVRDERDFEAHVNYVHINPVKHGFVARASDWQHSTIHAYIERGTVSSDWACATSQEQYGERYE